MAMVSPKLYLPDQLEFYEMTLLCLGFKFHDNIPQTVNFCRQNGLLARSVICHKCKIHCEERSYSRSIDKLVWRCPLCKGTKNIRVGSFFEKSHLHLWQILGVTYIWTRGCGSLRGMSVSQTMKELEIFSEHTVTDWHQFCRDVCTEYCLRHPQKIGGKGHLVKIYTESLSNDCKSSEQWMFGGYEPAKKIGFLVITAERNAETLIPLIQQWIHPGTTIYSENSEAYKSLGELGYVHKIVNQTQNSDNAEKNKTVKGKKSPNKKTSVLSLKSECSVDELSESIWHQKFKNHCFHALWFQIASELYPL